MLANQEASLEHRHENPFKLNRPGDVDNCVNLVGDEHLVNCDLIYDHCVSETVTDWTIEGGQQYRLLRGCQQRHDGEDTSCFQGKIFSIDLEINPLN